MGGFGCGGGRFGFIGWEWAGDGCRREIVGRGGVPTVACVFVGHAGKQGWITRGTGREGEEIWSGNCMAFARADIVEDKS